MTQGERDRLVALKKAKRFSPATALLQFFSRHDRLNALDQPLMHGKLRSEEADLPCDRRSVRGMFGCGHPFIERIVGER